MTDDHRPYDEHWNVAAAHPDASPGPGEVERLLYAPLKLDEPTVIRVGPFDLFHPDIPPEYIAAVYGVMAACEHHTFQVVTDYLDRAWSWLILVTPRDLDLSAVSVCLIYAKPNAVKVKKKQNLECTHDEWPLPNVWLGARASDQSEANDRVPTLLECRSALRFVELSSLEAAVDLTGVWDCLKCKRRVGRRRCQRNCQGNPALDWIIASGDTGPEAEPCDIDWMRAIRDQCEAAGVPCYIQQLGSNPAMNEYGADGSERLVPLSPDGWGDAYDHPHGADPSEWPEGLRVREMPEVQS